ncbi:hypothetical protein ACOWPK_19605 [Pseudomonas aeruginosa]|uniref:hypothetical protein n=1 Tax=Pseudomonas aeruginosa TaxID=287 RepID=UPI00068D9E2C|nr:hypothetical protein [Pseudomonas aeruginosa]MBX6029623.1 hypothetical protein [Pseudomonas aeruginosa]MCO3570034.1 hypothetical protein [Pseudomonas aeruginosa]HEP8042938.1 hypothetical protein [Pseudomonas aeruginosa]
MDIKPEAYCDALFIVNDAPSSVLPISVVEMHLFSYLGCILALFQGSPLGRWGYRYAITTEGFPFSAELESARNKATSSGLFSVDDNGMLGRTSRLAEESDALASIGESWRQRREWLRAATACALALPVGSIRYAINQSPGLVSSLRLGQKRALLQGDDVSQLYEEYGVIRSVLGEQARDVLSPAVIWLSAKVIRDQEAQHD